jgi:O-antigen ligase
MSLTLSTANNFEGWIFYLLLCLAALIAVPYGTVEIWWEAFFIVSVLLLFNAWLLQGALRGGLVWRPGGTPLAPLLALVLWSFLQSLRLLPGDGGGQFQSISLDAAASWFFAFHLLALALFMALIASVAKTSSRLKILVRVLLLIAAGSAVFGIARHLFLARAIESVFPVLKAGVGFAQFINRNHFALLMLMALGLSLSSALGRAARGEKIFYWSVSLILLSALALTTSRGAVIAFLAELTALLFLYLTGKFEPAKSAQNDPAGDNPGKSGKINLGRIIGYIRTAAFGLALIAAGAGTVIWVGDEKLIVRFEKGLDSPAGAEETEDARSPSRANIWKASLELFAARPVTGAGFGAYSTAIPQYFEGTGHWQLEEAHNDYLEFLASGGLVGALIGLWLIRVFVRQAIRQFQRSSRETRIIRCGAIGGLIGLAVHSLGDFGLHITVNAVTCAALAAILLANFNDDRQRQLVGGRSSRNGATDA